MNTMMNALYADGQGKDVTGVYADQPFMGVVTRVRPTFGGGLNVYIKLEEQIDVDGDLRDSLVIDGAGFHNGHDGVATNLHIYL